MKTEEKVFLYADKQKQSERANRFLVLGFIVFYVFVLGVVGVAFLRGIRSKGYTTMIAALILVATLATVFLYRRNRLRCVLRQEIFRDFRNLRQRAQHHAQCG